MADKEMAEKWIKDHSGLIGSYKFVKYDYNSLEQAYLAGLKAGKDMAEIDLATVAYMQGAERQKKKAEKQLIKAKEIIRVLLKHTHDQNLNTQNDFDLYLGRIKDAEQFLKEE